MKRQNPTAQADNLQNQGFGPCKLSGYLLFTGFCTRRRVGVKPCLLEANTVHCGGSERSWFGTFPIFPGFSRFVRGLSGDFPDLSFSSFPRLLNSTYEEQSRKGLRHNPDLSWKKWETPRFSFSQVSRGSEKSIAAGPLSLWMCSGLDPQDEGAAYTAMSTRNSWRESECWALATHRGCEHTRYLSQQIEDHLHP